MNNDVNHIINLHLEKKQQAKKKFKKRNKSVLPEIKTKPEVKLPEKSRNTLGNATVEEVIQQKRTSRFESNIRGQSPQHINLKPWLHPLE